MNKAFFNRLCVVEKYLGILRQIIISLRWNVID